MWHIWCYEDRSDHWTVIFSLYRTGVIISLSLESCSDLQFIKFEPRLLIKALSKQLTLNL